MAKEKDSLVPEDLQGMGSETARSFRDVTCQSGSKTKSIWARGHMPVIPAGRRIRSARAASPMFASSKAV